MQHPQLDARIYRRRGTPLFCRHRVDGSFEMPNVPPGDYVVAAWHEKLGTMEQHITLAPSGTNEVNFKFKGE